jgi:hypothetical protein
MNEGSCNHEVPESRLAVCFRPCLGFGGFNWSVGDRHVLWLPG